jgi:hypothetical protein
MNYRIKPILHKELTLQLGQFPHHAVTQILELSEPKVTDEEHILELTNRLSSLPYRLVYAILNNISNYIEDVKEETNIN